MKKEELEQFKRQIEHLQSTITNLASILREFISKRDNNFDAFVGWAQAYVDSYLPGRENIFDGDISRSDDMRITFAKAIGLAASRFFDIRRLEEENQTLRQKIAQLRSNNAENQSCQETG